MQVSFHGGVTQEKLDEIKDKALQVIVDRALKVQYAIDNEISVSPEIIDKKWSEFIDKNRNTLQGANPQVVSKYRADIYLTLLAEKAEVEAVDSGVKISEDDAREYYEANREKFLRPKLFTASHVFVKVDPASSEEEKSKLKTRADKLYDRAASGEDFYNLAYYESDDRSKYVGGKLGSFHAGQTVKEFDTALQKMEPGEIFGPVRTIYGYHIIKLDDVKPETQLSFEEGKESIISSLRSKQRKAIYDKWVGKLKALYAVMYY